MKTPSVWHVRMLGTLAARRNDAETLSRFPTQQTALLLAYLCCHPRRKYVREELIDLLWPEAELGAARLRLRVALNALRRRLEPPAIAPYSVLCTDAQWIFLQPGAVTTDVAEFEKMLDLAARENDAAAKKTCLTKAVALYQGELLPGYYADWIVTARAHLADRYLSALYALALASETEQDWPQSAAYARRVIEADPFHEVAHLLLMRLFARLDNAAAALRQYVELETILASVSAVPSRAARVLREQIRAGDYAVPAPVAEPPTPASFVSSTPPIPLEKPTEPDPAPPVLPSRETAGQPRMICLPARLTRFYGCAEEIARLAALLTEESVRLVTLTGIGGTGKTRLSLEAARHAKAAFDVVCFVPLSDVEDTRRLWDSIEQALCLTPLPDVAPLTQIMQRLDTQRSLLLLDNFEQLLPEGADCVHELLEQLPQLTVLVTSRQPLGLSGEHEWSILPLSLPAAHNLSPLEALSYPGVALYVGRAQTARPDFQITARNVSAIITLCGRLEGIPLAIELAASWAGTLTPAQMLARMTNRFDLLVSRRRDVPARHQTLRAAIHWSYDRLEPDLRHFFLQLSVFRGGWTLEAAEAVCREPSASLYLRLLRERAMVVANHSAGQTLLEEGRAVDGEDVMRYRMLETLREFALEQLQEHSEAEADRALSERHTRWCLTCLTQQNYALAEQENYRAAHDWARAQPDQEELYYQLVRQLSLFWRVKGWWREGLDCLEAALKRDPGAHPDHYAHILRSTASLCRMLQNHDAAMDYYERARVLLAQAGDHSGVIDVLNGMGCTALDMQRHDDAQRHLQQSLALAQQTQDDGMVASIHGNLGYVAMMQQQWPTAREHMQQCLAIHQKKGYSLAWPLQNLAELSQAQEQWPLARALYEESLALYRSMGETYRIAETLESLATVLEHCGEPEAAQRCHAEGHTLSRQLRGA